MNNYLIDKLYKKYKKIYWWRLPNSLRIEFKRGFSNELEYRKFTKEEFIRKYKRNKMLLIRELHKL